MASCLGNMTINTSFFVFLWLEDSVPVANSMKASGQPQISYSLATMIVQQYCIAGI